MNYLKSGWSFLSSSFTQAEEEDIKGDFSGSAKTGDSVSLSESEKERRHSLDSVDDLAEFADAVDAPSLKANDAQSSQYVADDSQGSLSTPNEFGRQPVHFEMELGGGQSSSVDGVLETDIPVENKEVVEKNATEGVVGYTSLEDSDSDDSGEFIPPPAAPVGPSVNTASQLNEIIHNLGGDLGILTLEEENTNETTLAGETTIGNTFYTTAYDQTICSSSLDETAVDTLTATAIEGDLGTTSENSSFDSAIASSSKSSNLSGDSVRLNFNSESEPAQEKVGVTVKESATEVLTHSDRESPLLNQDDVRPGTPLFQEDPFQNSVLDSTVREVEADDKQDHYPQLVIQPLGTESLVIDSSHQTTELESESVPETKTLTPDEIKLPTVVDEPSTLDLLPSAEEEAITANKATTEARPQPEVQSTKGEVESVVVDKPSEPDSLSSAAEEPVSADQTTTEAETQPELQTAKGKVESVKEDTDVPPPSTVATNNLSSDGIPATTKMDDAADAIPIARGSYDIDFDNLDDFNPFQCNKALQNSPEKPAKTFAASIGNLSKPCQDDTAIKHTATDEKLPNGVDDIADVKDVPNSITAAENVQDGTNLIDVPVNIIGGGDADSVVHRKVDASMNDANANLENVDPSAVKPAKKVIKKPSGKKTSRPVKKKPLAAIATPAADPVDGDDVIMPKGAYTIDFDNLDGFDPFKSSKGMSNSPIVTAPTTEFAEAHAAEETETLPDVTIEPEVPSSAEELEYMAIESNVSEEASNETAPEKPLPDPALAVVKSEPEEPSLPDKPVGLEPTPSGGVTSEPAKMPEENVIEEEVPPPKGAYSLDFDNLDMMDPFKTSKGLANSPTKVAPPGYSVDFGNLDAIDPFKPSKAMANSPPSSPTKTNLATDWQAPIETAPVKDEPVPDASSIADEVAPEKPASNEPKPVEKQLKLTADTVQKGEAKPKGGDGYEKPKTPPQNKPPPAEAEVNGEEVMPVPRGTYNLDFDNLGSMDPFKTNKGLANSPTKDAPTSDYSLNFDDLDKIDPFKPSKAMANSPPSSPPAIQQTIDPAVTASENTSIPPVEANVLEKTDASVAVQIQDAEAETKPKTVATKKKVPKSRLARKKLIKPSLGLPAVEPNAGDEEEIPVPKGAYNLDFDNLDAMDPFKSSKGLPNSPTKAAPSEYSLNFDDLDSVDPFKPSKAMANSPSGSPTEAVPPENATFNAVPDSSAPDVEAPEKEAEKDKQDDTEKPEVKAVTKKKKIPSGLARKKLLKPRPKPVETEAAEDEIPVPKGAYNLDFDNLDAMDPFKSSKGLSISPTKETPPAVPGYQVNLDDLENIDPFKPSKAMANSPPSSPTKLNPPVPEPIAIDAPIMNPLNETFENTGDTAVNVLTPAANESESTLSDEQLRKMEFERLNETETFYAANDVFQDSSLDYFDTLNSQPLTQSELRKQSLYVKFDPLVSDSPSRPETSRATQKASESVPKTRPTVVPELPSSAISSTPNDNRTEVLIDDIDQPTQDPKVDANVSMRSQSAMDSFNQPYLSQQSFQAASPGLKYTQADMDRILRKAESEWAKEKTEAKTKEQTLNAELEQMNQVVKEYEQLFNTISKTENGELTREQQLAKAEHEQSLEDLAALERSHDDLSRRYNKLKSVVAQFKQNEDILKKATSEMMEEAKVSRERYVTLKKQTDEEISKANKELQQVKANAQQEVARAQAQLKMLELKCDSLQSQIRDCNNENEELTKLCDELIACSKQAQG